MDKSIKKRQDDSQEDQGGNQSQNAGKQEENLQVVQAQAEPVADAPAVHAGGVIHPEGYTHVATIPNDDGSVRINVENLHENVEIDEVNGASLKLDRSSGDSALGFLHGRIIHDFHAFLHIFRKDDPENKKTHFKVHLGHGSGANI